MRAFVTAGPFFMRYFLLLCATFLCASCANLQTEFETQRRMLSDAVRTMLAAPRGRPGYWRPGPYKGAPKIVVDLGEQRAYFYRGKYIIGESNISTGRKGYETPPGRYRVTEKDADHISNQYGDYITEDGEIVMQNISRKDPKPPGTIFDGAQMPYFLRFRDGYGMHAGFVPRYRASHGCIRMPKEMARRFFNAAREGTPVIVKH